MTANDHKPHKGIKQKTKKMSIHSIHKCRHCKGYLHSLGGAGSSSRLKTATRKIMCLMIKISPIVNTGCGSVQNVCRRV